MPPRPPPAVLSQLRGAAAFWAPSQSAPVSRLLRYAPQQSSRHVSHCLLPVRAPLPPQLPHIHPRFAHARASFSATAVSPEETNPSPKVRLSRLVASHGTNLQMSRRSAERLILGGDVTVAGEVVTDPSVMLTLGEASAGGGIVKVGRRRLVLPSSPLPGGGGGGDNVPGVDAAALLGGRNRSTAAATIPTVRTRVWVVHKLPGEIVTDDDPHGRPSLLDRLRRGGVGKGKKKSKARVHLKPIGRLDMMTEGLILVTNDGQYAREMELPGMRFHRTYRARIHGRITESKLKAIRSGLEIDKMRYGGMNVRIERGSGRRASTWVRVTCREGKNRQIRKVFDHLGLKVTRLIRTSFGDYDLNTIPPGMAIEVPVKPIEKQKKKGAFSTSGNSNQRLRRNPRRGGDTGSGGAAQEEANERASPVQWIRHT